MPRLGSSTGTCAFEFDPAESDRHVHPESRLSADDLNADGVWECPHDALDGRERCLAHLDPADRPPAVDETEWFLDTVGASERLDGQRDLRRAKQFVGGRFRRLDLSAAAVEFADDFPLDLRYAEIDALDCAGSTLTRDLDLRMATVNEKLELDGEFGALKGRSGEFARLVLDDCRFRRIDLRDASAESIDLRNATVGTADLRNVAAQSADFDEATFDRGHFDFAAIGDARAHHATFGVVDFDNASFDRAEFYYADFGEADFRNVAAAESVFKGTAFDGAYFNGAELELANWIGAEVDNGHFSGARFDQASFAEAAFSSGGFEGCHFGWANFQRADFDSGDFANATFEQGTFRGAAFDAADFTGIDPAGALNLKDATFRGDLRIRPDPAAPPDDSLVDLRGSRVTRGVLSQSDSGRVIYDLAGATIGDVTFEGGDTDQELADSVRFLRTRFDGFDFRQSDDIELKRTNYNIHALFDGAEALASRLMRYGVTLAETRRSLGSEPSAYESLRSAAWEATDPGATKPNYRNPPSSDLEYTYLLAKNGANTINDNECSSKFFVREMRQRRKRHAELFGDADALDAKVDHGVDWLENTVLGYTSGYGESPSRVIYTSLFIVGAFAALYYLLSPTLYENPLNFAVLSIGSFVTLVIGGVGDVPVTSINLLTQVEAFVGAFSIAMFVFTLTRSIHR